MFKALLLPLVFLTMQIQPHAVFQAQEAAFQAPPVGQPDRMPHPHPDPRPMPWIRIPDEDRSQPTRLTDLSISVQVVGHTAITTWDMTVFNPQSRVLEGELLFPLGEGESVSRFAMDVNGRLREGVVVEKAKGRAVFESVVREKIDPGLLEKTEGNNFRARVYPIPAKGHKRVVVAFEQELQDLDAAKGSGLLYRLPLDFKDTVDSFTLRFEVLDQPEKPRLDQSPMDTFAFKTWQRGFVAEETRRDFLANKPLVVSIPKGEGSTSAFFEERSGQTYVYAMVHPRLSRSPKALPKKLAILWDASASARNRDTKRELDLLEAYLKKIGAADIQLRVFRNELEAPRSFKLKGGDGRDIRKVLEGLPMDGATRFASLDLKDLKVDEALLFSDGLNNFGPGHLGSGELQSFPCPVVAINSASQSDHARLKALSEASGGEYLNLQKLGSGEAAQALLTRPLMFLRATYPAGDLQEVYPAAAQAVRGPFGIAGILKADKTRVTLHFGFGNQETFTRTLELDRSKMAVDAPVARLWAQKKLAMLSLDGHRNALNILKLGREHSLVTDETSLIVLDDVADYVRHEIEPPAELRAEYDARIKTQRQDKMGREKSHLESVISAFEERKQWWKTVFKPRERAQKQGPSRPQTAAGSNAVSHAEVVMADMAPAPPPPPPPPPASPSAPRLQRRTERASSGASREVASTVEVVAASDAPEPESKASIHLKAWNPDTPYLRELKSLPLPKRYDAYLRLRENYGQTPGFFLDVSDLFLEQGEAKLALRILSNLAELKLEDASLLRVLGYRLRQMKHYALSVEVFERVLRMREEEPQSRRDLALACADHGQAQRALDLLWEVVKTPWNDRFRDVNLIACGELNALLASYEGQLDTSAIDKRLLENLPVDIRVVLNWDTDNSDMDLHVLDPRGEECFYSHARTELGGRISADVTGGYGPEEFLLKKAIPGRYKIKANYYGTGQQTAIGATTVVLELYLRYGTGKVENRSVTLRLSGQSRMADIGELVFE